MSETNSVTKHKADSSSSREHHDLGSDSLDEESSYSSPSDDNINNSKTGPGSTDQVTCSLGTHQDDDDPAAPEVKKVKGTKSASRTSKVAAGVPRVIDKKRKISSVTSPVAIQSPIKAPYTRAAGTSISGETIDLTTTAGQLKMNPGMSLKLAKFEAKREYNRVHAAQARQRNKSMVGELERKVKGLTDLVEELKKANQSLRAQIAAKGQNHSSGTGRDLQPAQAAAPAAEPLPAVPDMGSNEVVPQLARLLLGSLTNHAPQQQQQQAPGLQEAGLLLSQLLPLLQRAGTSAMQPGQQTQQQMPYHTSVMGSQALTAGLLSQHLMPDHASSATSLSETLQALGRPAEDAVAQMQQAQLGQVLAKLLGGQQQAPPPPPTHSTSLYASTTSSGNPQPASSQGNVDLQALLSLLRRGT